jgi:hypothetical protein
VHCDDGHGRNIIEALQPYAADALQQQRMLSGAMRALDARQRWFDGLLSHVFQEAPALPSTSGVRVAVPASEIEVENG